MVFDSGVDNPEGDSHSNSENGIMEPTKDPKLDKKEILDFQSAREAFESIGVSLPSLEFHNLQTGLTSLIGVRNGNYDAFLTKKEFCNILQMENAGRQSCRRRLVFIKKLASCFHEFSIPSCKFS